MTDTKTSFGLVAEARCIAANLKDIASVETERGNPNLALPPNLLRAAELLERLAGCLATVETERQLALEDADRFLAQSKRIGALTERVTTIEAELAALRLAVAGRAVSHNDYPPASIPETLPISTPAPRAFKVGDRVRIARKVEVDSKGRDCSWTSEVMDRFVGGVGVILHDWSGRNTDDPYPLCVSDGGGSEWYSPDALDLITPAED